MNYYDELLLQMGKGRERASERSVADEDQNNIIYNRMIDRMSVDISEADRRRDRENRLMSRPEVAQRVRETIEDNTGNSLESDDEKKVWQRELLRGSNKDKPANKPKEPPPKSRFDRLKKE